jgi:hypothetical protein
MMPEHINDLIEPILLLKNRGGNILKKSMGVEPKFLIQTNEQILMIDWYYISFLKA